MDTIVIVGPRAKTSQDTTKIQAESEFPRDFHWLQISMAVLTIEGAEGGVNWTPSNV